MVGSTSYIELSRSAYAQNLAFMKQELGPKVRFSSVVKGNAYGHGIEPFSQMALSCGVDHFSVFSTDEAYRVKQVVGEKAEIMIMGMVANSDLEWCMRQAISFYVFDLARLEAALELGKQLGLRPKIHLEIDTGMNRTGVDHREFKRALAMLGKYEGHYVLQGFCTHFAGAESIANDTRVQRQYRGFERASKRLITQGFHPKMRHTACSAASMSYPKTRMDMCRIGIMQYGFWPSKETFIQFAARRKEKTDPLRRVISWKSQVMSTHDVKAGEFIGYGTSFLAENDMRIATVPVGYCHGYSRGLSNQGRILIGGVRVGVIGLVNMNMLIADVTHLPETKLEEEVVLIGKQDDMELSVASFGELSNQLNYELLTRLPMNIHREIIQ
jgi:alanine racemase